MVPRIGFYARFPNPVESYFNHQAQKIMVNLAISTHRKAVGEDLGVGDLSQYNDWDEVFIASLENNVDGITVSDFDGVSASGGQERDFAHPERSRSPGQGNDPLLGAAGVR